VKPSFAIGEARDLLSILTTNANELEEAFLRHRSEIYAFLLRRTRNHCDAEELTQQVFADAALALSRSDLPRSMRPWLFAIAARRFVDELRRRRPVMWLRGERDLVDEPDELPQALEDAVARLPALQREIVVMRVVEGRTYREIARALDSSEAACKMRLSRALRRLRNELDPASSQN
jgi:RNA polymerase sigma-70 factor (ECF subfamily)